MESLKSIEVLLNEIENVESGIVVRDVYASVKEEFDTKPASTKYHHVGKGDFGRHTQEVMNVAVNTYDQNRGLFDCTRDDVIISAFVHDFSKIGRYKELLITDWRRQPKYGARQFETDSSEVYMSEPAKVVYLCAKYGLELSTVVINAVTFHHGFVSESAKDNSYAMQQMTSLSVLLHFADMMSVKAYDRKP